MFIGFQQHKCFTLQEAQSKQEEIKKKTHIMPEIFKIQEHGNHFFIVIEQPRNIMVESDITRLIKE